MFAQQDTIRISLEEAIYESGLHSVDALVAKNEFNASYWEYRTYKADLLPEILLEGTLPYYSKSYNQFQNTDGSYTYVSNDYAQLDASISIDQNIPWTGGKLSVKTDLQRLDQFGGNSSTQYMLMPAAVTLEQPVFGFNQVKWSQKIEPVKYMEAKARLLSQLETVTITAINYYFNLLSGEMNLNIAVQNYQNSERLYTIAQARRNIGQISENDLLQLKVSCLKAEGYVTEARSALKASMFQMRSFLGYGENVILIPSIPQSLTDLQLNYERVSELATQNSVFSREIRRRQLEASRDVSQAKADRFNISLFLSFGLSGQDNHIPEIFDNLRNNQVINLGVRVPILDWGKGKGKVKMAESNREVVKSQIEKEKIDFNQNVFLYVENFNNQSKQLEIASEADRIAQKRYETSVEAFVLGKIDVLNLNDAQSSKDEARRRYIDQMYLLWLYYYRIRSVTLYDFANNCDLYADYAGIVK
ncbi:MAG: TolC family protein [Candidatus Azobacteroides sp.]|nr:TolC family protein [Candidatus Azobacteroides sp.]